MEISMKEALSEDPLGYDALESELDCCDASCCSPDCCCCCPSCADCCPSCADCCPSCCSSCCPCPSPSPIPSIPTCPSCGDCCSCMGCGDGCPGCTTCCSACPGCESCCQLGCGCCLRYLCCLPRLLCSLPKLIGHSLHLKRILIIVVIVVLVVLVIVGALLLGLHITQEHSEAVLQMTAKALEGEASWPARAWEEEAATFHLNAGANNPATAVYDYSKLLIGYRSWLGQACYVTRMDKDNIQGLDAITKAFQYHQGEGQDKGFSMPPGDRSTLGTTINILCSHLPIYWA